MSLPENLPEENTLGQVNLAHIRMKVAHKSKI